VPSNKFLGLLAKRSAQARQRQPKPVRCTSLATSAIMTKSAVHCAFSRVSLICTVASSGSSVLYAGTTSAERYLAELKGRLRRLRPLNCVYKLRITARVLHPEADFLALRGRTGPHVQIRSGNAFGLSKLGCPGWSSAKKPHGTGCGHPQWLWAQMFPSSGAIRPRLRIDVFLQSCNLCAANGSCRDPSI
jgi:hypothetical protein